jgi:plasmid stabilization system protein ParE
MDHALIWSNSATCDLNAIVRYIGRRNAAAGQRIGAEITKAIGVLRRHPFMGAVYERDKTGRVRELLCRNYRIFYQVDEPAKQVEILAVWHASRQEPDLPF